MFGWEPGDPPRTVCDYNLRHLEWPQDPSDGTAWLKQWACAFDKEPLTREFFKRFDKVLEHMKADLEQYQHLPSAEAYSRSQLLLERMIFAYFLQNRGWLNRQRDYLVGAFEPYRDKPDEFTFYEKSLEPLFWTLASAPDSPSRLPGVPFLNGGLFDDDEFRPSVKPRRDNPPLRIRNSTFAYAFSHLFEAFNFTVREDTPLDQDVAVDPEMLGKVFESIVLHAEAEAEYNAPDKRKATGSYYTPRIVVHFICREALRLYLKGQLPGPEWDARFKLLFNVDPTEGIESEEMEQLKSVFRPRDGRALLTILRDIKTCDPAVGSGAFPVGLLHELVNLRRIAETVASGFVDPARREGSNWVHDTKAHIVENCLCGVDIQQQAIEICRLRLWLSLIVEYDLGVDPFEADPAQFDEAIRGISRLPNLEMNFRRGDSLLDMICEVNVRIEYSRRYRKEYDHIRNLSRDLHKAYKGERKRKLRVDILRSRLGLTTKVLTDEIKQLQTEDSNLAGNWFGETQSESHRRRQIAGEIEHLQEALLRIAADRKTLEKIAGQPYDSRFYPKLRKLEGAEFDAPFNFAWRLDFADIFHREGDGTLAEGGFDVVLGNPPFVTARNPEKRELYRERWKRVCSGKYLLVCPFFDLSFGLLRPGGQLGFIVSNAFTKREFGKPLVEDFFPTVNLQKVVDCSGLMFPGHGTPTCIVFGTYAKAGKEDPIRMVMTLPGGGDLRTPPEESPLWHTIETRHGLEAASPLSKAEGEVGFRKLYEDLRIVVGDCERRRILTHPCIWSFYDWPTTDRIVCATNKILRDVLDDDLGVCTMTNCDEVLVLYSHEVRRLIGSTTNVRLFQEADMQRDWSTDPNLFAVFPYDMNGDVLPPDKLNRETLKYLEPYKHPLESRKSFGNKTFKQLGRVWYEHERMNRTKYKHPLLVSWGLVATHIHALPNTTEGLFKQTNIVATLRNSHEEDVAIVAALMNSSAALFWAKQVCFSRRESEESTTDTYYEFAGVKVQDLPVPLCIVGYLQGNRTEITSQLVALSEACWHRGRELQSLTMRKVFEKAGEAYHAWNSTSPGHIEPYADLGKPFTSSAELRQRFTQTAELRDALRGEMIGAQEEMDWLMYAAYGLIPLDSPAVSVVKSAELIASISREQRPFILWQQAEGDFERACSLIPDDWARVRKALWRARLECIRDNEHIRRIEQPVYKRRWDEQWKVSNRWQCGPVAYDAEFADAFDWWLSEKAEWWLENEVKGGPVSMGVWTEALWQDSRVQAAWPVVREALDRLGDSDTFERHFRDLVRSQSVPDNIPWAVSWDELEKKMSVPASAKRIRGKLNVPRERFRITSEKTYVWAGLRIFDRVSEDDKA
jgi:hypothetical protein